jgi:hypothetical protein
LYCDPAYLQDVRRVRRKNLPCQPIQIRFSKAREKLFLLIGSATAQNQTLHRSSAHEFHPKSSGSTSLAQRRTRTGQSKAPKWKDAGMANAML